MTETQLEDLLFTLDICADSLPFDPQAVHVRRLETIKAILISHHKERVRRAPTTARVLSLVGPVRLKHNENEMLTRS